MKEINCKLIINFVKGYYENLGYTVIDFNNKSGQKSLNVFVDKNQLYVFTGYRNRTINFDFINKKLVILDLKGKQEVTIKFSDYLHDICDLMM
jgi:hypothetical protein